MEPWTFIASFWFTTWLMLIWRTYSISMRMIGQDQKGAYITQNKRLHFIVYCLGILIITPFIWPVALFEEPRRKWVIAYVNGISVSYTHLTLPTKA